MLIPEPACLLPSAPLHLQSLPASLINGRSAPGALISLNCPTPPSRSHCSPRPYHNFPPRRGAGLRPRPTPARAGQLACKALEPAPDDPSSSLPRPLPRPVVPRARHRPRSPLTLEAAYPTPIPSHPWRPQATLS
ncbi:actin-binding protein WASF1-like [Moschus berezovskii]|uniref:actin-binding protein WASF1-like n=1 Tax=Moschus berezovskii TaxID=68408 RepID=UPI00244470E5|nr:actin-binding protein WASF1-like [Moschus berezovskii]